MRSIILAAAFAALSTSAMAADIIYEAPADPLPVLPQAYNWNGFYVGLNAGYGFSGDADFLGTVDGGSGTADIDGFLGGVQVGHNWQNGSWVLGLEADIQYSDVSGSIGDPLVELTNDLDYFGTVRGRVGYAFDNVLPYITGGFAFGRNEVTANEAGVISVDDQTHSGYSVGAGVEYGVTEKVSVKLEYLYTDLGDETYFEAFTNPIRTDVDFHTIRAGVNFRF